MSNERLPGESTFRYHLRLNGRQSTKPDIDEMLSFLPSCGERWEDFAIRMRQRRVGRKKATVEYITALINLVYHTSLSLDSVYVAIVGEHRHQQILRAKKRYREKNRQLLSQKELARYYRKKNQDSDS